ncbi:DUF2254 domain-containing protein [Loktanella sp. M215]|uniref:DUF2254 domain-containing protein n=1 Tax=Loktanella sp. M215 TaxID=2675431 RepID=UPI001F42F6B6|nr:DUF2254 domain-containing protein [Loktanella sp. M215]
MALFGSRALLRKLIEETRSSYWFWPSTLVIGGLLLGRGAIAIDLHPDVLPFDLPDRLTAIDPSSASNTLSTLATAVIGVAGVMFSMTLVAVSFAADTFGPRLIGNFMRDRGTQISFGLLLGTFVFNVIVLRAVQDGDAPFVPYVGLATAMGLTLMSVFTIIYYIHHVPETINVSNIASNLGHTFSASIRGLIDDRSGHESETVNVAEEAESHDIALTTTGYIQQLDKKTLVDCARDNDWVIAVRAGPGDFVTPHQTVMVVTARDALTDKQIKTLQDAFATGNARTEAQSTTFIADELVEMIARALSPGFNDPFTAMNCLNWLHAGLLEALLYDGGLSPHETQRVRFQHLDFAGLFQSSFVAAAPYTVTDKMCRERHLALTKDLLDRATGARRDAIADLLPTLSATSPERAL